MKRKILVITGNERMGKWFRDFFGGRKSGLTTTVVADLQEAIRALKRTRPHVVLFVEDGPEKVDDRLMLLRALLLIEEQCRQNTLTILYNPSEERMTMYHNVHFPRANQLDVAMAAKEGAHCPLFGDLEDMDAAESAYPADCPYLPVVTRGALLAALTAKAAAGVVVSEGEDGKAAKTSS